MKSVRERFEEIWPVPGGVFWRDSKGRYGCHSVSDVYAMDAHNIRLDTFTRCQETTSIYESLVDELVGEMDMIRKVSGDLDIIDIARSSIDRAKQIMEQKK